MRIYLYTICITQEDFTTLKNRLDLNFQLETAEERNKFVQEYLPTLPFTPNQDELETISNYILWGKNKTGRNIQQEGFVELKSWTRQPVESLEALLEQPGFGETSFQSLNAPSTRPARVVFDRAKALADAPSYLAAAYKDLFRQIDTVELTLNYYELFCGRRKLPPRAKLIDSFTEDEARDINEKALKLSQHQYLKLKRLLVELRTTQYTLADSAGVKIRQHFESIRPIWNSERLVIGEDVNVLPLGMFTNGILASKLFTPNPHPALFREDELRALSALLWKPTKELNFDFRKPEHLLKLYEFKFDLESEKDTDQARLYQTQEFLLKTLHYYEERADLSDLQQDLLEMKLTHKLNSEIASFLNKKYDKHYNENYISTLFHQKLIPQIAQAAIEHREIAENLFFPENFKKCRDCGRVLLLDADNFVRQKKSMDGFAPRCKKCEKVKRSRYAV